MAIAFLSEVFPYCPVPHSTSSPFSFSSPLPDVLPQHSVAQFNLLKRKNFKKQTTDENCMGKYKEPDMFGMSKMHFMLLGCRNM